MKPLASFTNPETGMTAFVFANHKSGYNVTLRDDDSGEFVGLSLCGIADLDTAKAKAHKAAMG